jgi:YbbR domain-containing protein
MTITELKNKITENWKVKVICVILAIGIYLFGQYVTFKKNELTVPLKVKNASNLVYTNELPRSAKVIVYGDPNQIGLLQEKDFEVYIDLSELVEPGTFEIPLHLQLSERASKMENVEFSLKNDTISLTLENKITALVPVKTNFSGACANGYEVTATETYPDLVQITGRASLIEKISYLETDVINLSGKSSDFTKTVKVINQNSRISLTGDKEVTVTVKIKPIKITKVIDSSVVFFYSLKNDLSVENPNINYSLTLTGTKNELENFVLSPLSVQIDCSEIESSGVYELPFSVILPSGITLDKIEPSVATLNIVDFVEIPIPENTASDSQIDETKDEQNNEDSDSESTSEEDINTIESEVTSEDKNSLPITE